MSGREKLLVVTVSEPSPADGPQLREDAPAVLDESRGRLNQPWRLAVVAVEVLLVVLLALASWRAWQLGTVSMEVPMSSGALGMATRSVSSWWTASIGAAVLAGLFVLDAFRHLMLAWGGRSST